MPQVTFEPGLEGTVAPLGRWTAKDLLVPRTFLDPNGDFHAPNIYPQSTNDLALIWLNPLLGRQIGDVTGWFGYAVGDYSFGYWAGFGETSRIALVHEIGYCSFLDGGTRLQASIGPAKGACWELPPNESKELKTASFGATCNYLK